MYTSRREFLRGLGLSAAAIPFAWNLPSFARADGAAAAHAKKRLVVMFSPNGTLPDKFWPDEEGDAFTLKPILAPLERFKDRMLFLRGVANKVRGDGDGHMRGMSCLLTGIELFPGNIQGGSDTPAGWAKGISIDQEIKNFFQSRDESRTRFGSLEFGVVVPDRADPWTRMVYAGPNQPVAPIDDPYQMFEKLYGRVQDQESLKSILDEVTADLRKIRDAASAADRRLLEEHETFVREMEAELRDNAKQQLAFAAPSIEQGVKNTNDNMPRLSRMQIDLLVNSFANDMARVATLQFTNSVGNARMRWLGVDNGHHELSHDPDLKTESQEKLLKINVWFAEQLAYLVTKLHETPEPGGEGTMLDHTLLIWTNELGKGNSHTLNDIPWFLVGGGWGFKHGRSLRYKQVPHNRLHIALANAAGHGITTFGNPKLSADGALTGLT
jgi:hypothetical protein